MPRRYFQYGADFETVFPSFSLSKKKMRPLKPDKRVMLCEKKQLNSSSWNDPSFTGRSAISP